MRSSRWESRRIGIVISSVLGRGVLSQHKAMLAMVVLLLIVAHVLSTLVLNQTPPQEPLPSLMDGQLSPYIISCLFFYSPSDNVNKPSLFCCETRPVCLVHSPIREFFGCLLLLIIPLANRSSY